VLKVLVRMLFTTSVAISACPLSYGQLPPTNMGKYVHQPGDNQYSPETQAERHSPVYPARVPVTNPVVISVPQQQQQERPPAPFHPVPAPRRPDYSLQPISCDEPLKPPGFPPLPDRLDFSNVVGFDRVDGFTALGQSGSGSAARATSKGPARPEGVYEHYLHYDPRAFVPDSDHGLTALGQSGSGTTSGSGAQAASTQVTSKGPTGPEGTFEHYLHYPARAFVPDSDLGHNHNVYKVTTPGSDYYNVNSPNSAPSSMADSTAQPAFQSAAGNALKSMGPQPRLLRDQPVQPAAPSPVTVNQAVTQDLSLPEDQFSSGQAVSQNTTGKRVAQRTGQLMNRVVNQVVNQGAGTATSMISRFR